LYTQRAMVKAIKGRTHLQVLLET